MLVVVEWSEASGWKAVETCIFILIFVLVSRASQFSKPHTHEIKHGIYHMLYVCKCKYIDIPFRKKILVVNMAIF